MRRSMSRRGQRDTRQRGATLTEILVILALLAMLSLLSIPSLINVLKSFEVRGTASAIAAGIRRTQGLAVKNHKTYFIVFNPVNGSTNPTFCWDPPSPRTVFAIVEESVNTKEASSSNCQADCSDNNHRVAEWGPSMPEGTKFVSGVNPSADPYDIGGATATAYHGTMCFSSRGYAPVGKLTGFTMGSGAYVGNENKKHYRRVRVELTGKTTVQRYDGVKYVDQ